MKFLAALLLLTVTGCVCLDPKHKNQTAPSVSTEQVIEQLAQTKQALKEAGDSNTKVSQHVDKALTLAEKLDAILVYIESSYANKNIKL